MSKIDFYDILEDIKVIKTQPYQLVGREMEASLSAFGAMEGASTMISTYMAQDGTEITIKKRIYRDTPNPEKIINLPINL